MFDDMFPFADLIIGLNEDATSFIIDADTFYDFIQKSGLDKSTAPGKIEVPLDVVISLLKPEELEKLRNYITAYTCKGH